MADLDPFEPINPKDFEVDDTKGTEEINPADVGLDDVLDDKGGSLDGEEQFDDEEVDPVGDAALGGGDASGKIGLEEPTLVDSANAGDPTLEKQKEIIEPKWQVVPQDNNDIVSQHEKGFLLRARPLSSKQGNKIKYAAQLTRNNEVLDKGVIWVDRDANPVDFLQNVADRIISKFNLIDL